MLKRTLLFLTIALTAQAQPPQITPGGVVSAASYGSPIAPGELISIFGANFVTGKTSVAVNGFAAQVVGVTPTQANAIVPVLPPPPVPIPGLVMSASVVVTTPAGSSSGEIAALVDSAPGLFTADGSGCGQAAALNIRPDGTVFVNSASNSAAPGDYVALFGTGFSGASTPLLTLDNTLAPSVAYSGPAPGLAGVEQVNFQVPASTRNGCAVPVAANQGLFGSPTVTVAVQSGRGKCVDPPIQSYGTVILGSYFSAVFPAGPNLSPPVPETIVFAPQWARGAVPLGEYFLSPAPINFRSCAVAGYTNLSAGTIQIQPPSGAAVTVQPSAASGSGVSYLGVLPSGFLTPGTYTISGSFGSPVPLETTLAVGSPIQIISSFPSGTTLSQGQPLTVKWTGGDSTSLVRVALVSDVAAYSYAYATAGSLTFSPTGLAAAPNAQITVDVLPATPKSLLLPGITGPVSLSWRYSYIFQVRLGN